MTGQRGARTVHTPSHPAPGDAAETHGVDAARRGTPVSLRGLAASARQAGIAVGFVGLLLVFSALSPSFLSVSTLTNIAQQSAITAIIGIGMTFVIITAGIDLSVGSTLALTGVVLADLMARGVPAAVAVGAALALGVALGAVNGALVVKARLPPFIVTLGSLSAYRGFALLYTGGRPVLGVPDGFREVFGGTALGLPTPVWIALVVAVIAHLVLRHTRSGEYTLAVGGNREAARLAGVRVGRTTGATYMVSGLLAALAAAVLVARVGAAEPIAGEGYELTAIAAAAMGGASLAGGRGSVVGTVLGALLIGTLQAGLTILNVPAFYQLVAIGVVTVLAVLADRREQHDG